MTERIIGCAIEVHCTLALTGVHQAQMLTYMKVSGTGLLINFNVSRLIDAVRRFRI